MENELRYYLKQMQEALKNDQEVFVPTYLVTAVKLPTGAIELSVNTENIPEKIEYILEAYDDEMALKTNPDILMVQLMVV